LSTAGPADARNAGIRQRTMPATETSADNAPGMKTHPLTGRGLASGPARARRRAQLELEKTSALALTPEPVWGPLIGGRGSANRCLGRKTDAPGTGRRFGRVRWALAWTRDSGEPPAQVTAISPNHTAPAVFTRGAGRAKRGGAFARRL
jgi:hypothetical protein